MPSIRDTIARVAEEEGIDPSYALAVAERESAFKPTAKNSKTIFGLFQMRGDLRRQYGSGDSSDPEVQTRAWARFTHDLKGKMTERLGREPTNPELYAGHHFGPGRASSIIGGKHADLSPSDVFSPYELSINPHLNKRGTVGEITGGITQDIERRMARYGGGQNSPKSADNGQNPSNSDGQASDFAAYGEPVEPLTGVNTAKSSPLDLSKFRKAEYGEPGEMPGANPGMSVSSPSNEGAKTYTGLGVASAGALPPDQGGADRRATPGHDRFQQFPESPRVRDDRNLPASEKPTPTELLMEGLSRYSTPITGGRTYPIPHGRSEPLATDAGIRDIPQPGNRINPNADKYPAELEQEKRDEQERQQELERIRQAQIQAQAQAQARAVQPVQGIPIPALPQVPQPSSGYGLQ